MSENNLMNTFGKKASVRFAELEWPNKKDEEWRRTPASKFPLDRTPAQDSPSPAFTGKDDWTGYSAVVLVEGSGAKLVHTEAGSPVPVLEDSAPWVAEALEAALSNCDNKVLALNLKDITSLHALRLPKNTKGEKPVLVVVREGRSGALVQPHLAVKAEGLSDWSLILRYESAPGSQVLMNSASTFLVEDGARLNVTEVQLLDESSYFIDHALAVVGRDGVFDHLNVSLGAQVSKNRLAVRLTGSGADLHTRGLYFAMKDQHKDLNVIQDHIAPQATSRALYKGAVRDRARAVFQGLIVVEEKAAGTDAYLSNKNLLMNDGARADSLPQLKIDNNDVKCSHGSTTGKVDEEQVFYLQGRGLTRQEAKLLIAQGLFAELIEAAPAVLKEELEHLISEAVL